MLTLVLRLVYDDHLADIVGLEEINTINSLEGRTDCGKVHNCSFVGLPIDSYFESYSITGSSLSLTIQLHFDLGHNVTLGIVEILLNTFRYLLRKTNHKLILRLKYTRHNKRVNCYDHTGKYYK